MVSVSVGCSTRKITHILQVSVGGMNLWSIFVVKGHAPEAVVLDLACNVEVFPEFVRRLFH